MEVISKNKPEGKAYSKIKAKRKQTRILQEKAIKQRTENKRINAENRKAILNTENLWTEFLKFRLLNSKKICLS